MESRYQQLNKKLDILTNQNPKHNTKQKEHNFQPRIMNLSDVLLTKEQTQRTVNKGTNPNTRPRWRRRWKKRSRKRLTWWSALRNKAAT
jgi:hypothetical protein